MTDIPSSCPASGSNEELEGLVPYGEGLTYNQYLKINELKNLQHPRSDPPHHDEMLFIIIHQAYELWFRLVIHELESGVGVLEENDPYQGIHHVRRCKHVMELLTRQIHLLETMRPKDFLEFRDELKPASGFQSLQFREIEFLLGLKNEEYLKFFKSEPEEQEQLRKRLEQKDLRQAFYGMLPDQGFDLPADLDEPGALEDETKQEQVFSVLKEVYSYPEENQKLYILIECLIELDEALSLWRDHHVRVVERIIGTKKGTGGSSGVSYLQSTTDKRCFPMLWEVRTRL